MNIPKDNSVQKEDMWNEYSDVLKLLENYQSRIDFWCELRIQEIFVKRVDFTTKFS